MPDPAWPALWQREAITAIAPYLDTDATVDLLVGDPETSIHGSRLAGYLFTNNGEVWVIHDRSGRPDVYPGRLLRGPVLQIRVREPGKRSRLVYAHPEWTPPN